MLLAALWVTGCEITPIDKTVPYPGALRCNLVREKVGSIKIDCVSTKQDVIIGSIKVHLSEYARGSRLVWMGPSGGGYRPITKDVELIEAPILLRVGESRTFSYEFPEAKWGIFYTPDNTRIYIKLRANVAARWGQGYDGDRSTYL